MTLDGKVERVLYEEMESMGSIAYQTNKINDNIIIVRSNGGGRRCGKEETVEVIKYKNKK